MKNNLVEQVRQNLESVGIDVESASFELSEAVESTVTLLEKQDVEVTPESVTVVIESIGFQSEKFLDKLSKSSTNWQRKPLKPTNH